MSTSFTRRRLGQIALATAAAGALRSVAEQPSVSLQSDAPAGSFPKGFLWGTATASYQVEGAARQDGRGVSIWDTFSHKPGNIAHNDTGDVADDEFHLYKSDVHLLRELGVKTYRFSISWPRIFPAGKGAPNLAGLAFYEKLVDELLQSGIQPYCTLYHWDLPQALQDEGGWQNPDTPKHFADYAGYIAGRLSDRIRHFMTLNEISTFTGHGYREGSHAPGLKLKPRDFAQVNHHAVLAHGLGVQAIRATARPGTQIGLAENPIAVTPVMDTPANIKAAATALREENAPYLTAILEGRYTEAYLAGLGSDQPRFTDSEMKIIASPLDFVGLNIYQPTYVLADDSPRGYSVVQPSDTFPRMLSPWLTIGPECLYWTPKLVHQVWNVNTLYITENGASATDTPTESGQIMDIDRVMYLRNYLGQLQRAVAEGVPVKGYFVWSLLDNYEWADGYGKRFGLVYVDFQTQKRTPKLSAKFYNHVITTNHVV
jgi:beta-glucosidase